MSSRFLPPFRSKGRWNALKSDFQTVQISLPTNSHLQHLSGKQNETTLEPYYTLSAHLKPARADRTSRTTRQLVSLSSSSRLQPLFHWLISGRNIYSLVYWRDRRLATSSNRSPRLHPRRRTRQALPDDYQYDSTLEKRTDVLAESYNNAGATLERLCGPMEALYQAS